VQANREDPLDDFILKFRGNAIAIARDLSITAWTRRLSRFAGRSHPEGPRSRSELVCFELTD
jgi:hypothetical protein